MMPEKPDWQHRWGTLPTRKKVLTIGGGVLALLAMRGTLDGNSTPAPQAMQMVTTPDGRTRYFLSPDMAGEDGYAAYPRPSAGDYSGQTYGYSAVGGYAGAYDPSAADAQMQQWEAQQRTQSQGMAAYDQTIVDQYAIEDNATGQYYGAVDGGVPIRPWAGAKYSYVPTADMPEAGE